MKYKTDYPKLLAEMMSCISEILNGNTDNKFTKLFSEIKTALHKDYFAPYEKEDIFMIAVKLDDLYFTAANNSHSQNINALTMPYIDTLSSIILLLNLKNEKTKNIEILKGIRQFYEINIADSLLRTTQAEETAVKDIIEKCKNTVIQIEYTIIKNS